jgi:tetratricopeptide (TPR) repeat protein
MASGRQILQSGPVGPAIERRLTMLSKSKIRGLLVAGATLVVMAVVFVAVYDWGSEQGTMAPNVPIRVARNDAPVVTTEPVQFPEVATASQPDEAGNMHVADPEPPREVTYKEAEEAYHDRRYNEAVALFTRYTEQKSENPWGHYMLGLSAWKAGDPDAAEKAFEQALELDARHVKSRLNLSRVLLELHRPEEALVRVNEALLIDPESTDAYRLKGRAYRQMGQTNDAIRAYRRTIQIDPEDAWSMNNLALIRIEGGQFDMALPPLARAVELTGDVSIFLNNLGMALEGTGHFRAAQDAYQTAVDIDASYYKAAMNLSRIEGVLEDPDLEPVDLEVAARNFVDEIERWDRTLLASEQIDVVDPKPETFVASDADSTVDGRDQTP